MLKNVVLHVSGIVRKQVVEHEQINDFMTYILQEDLNNLNKYHGNSEDYDYYKQALNLFVEFDNHLFPICRIRETEALKEYTLERIKNELIELFNKSIENKTARNYGMAQFLGKVKEFQEVQQYKKDIECAKKEEKERQERELQLQKEKEWNLKLNEAEKKFLNNEKIGGDCFLGLLDRYNIKLPLRTKGWAMESLSYINTDSYSYYGNPSKVILDYAKELKSVLTDIEEENKEIKDFIKNI